MKDGAKLWYMSPWSCQELEAAHLYELAAEDVRKAFTMCGGSARSCLERAHESSIMQDELGQALDMVDLCKLA